MHRILSKDMQRPIGLRRRQKALLKCKKRVILLSPAGEDETRSQNGKEGESNPLQRKKSKQPKLKGAPSVKEPGQKRTRDRGNAPKARHGVLGLGEVGEGVRDGSV